MQISKVASWNERATASRGQEGRVIARKKLDSCACGRLLSATAPWKQRQTALALHITAVLIASPARFPRRPEWGPCEGAQLLWCEGSGHITGFLSGSWTHLERNLLDTEQGAYFSSSGWARALDLVSTSPTGVPWINSCCTVHEAGGTSDLVIRVGHFDWN